MANMTDCRDLDATGWEIPSENYCDQPYVEKTTDQAETRVVTYPAPQGAAMSDQYTVKVNGKPVDIYIAPVWEPNGSKSFGGPYSFAYFDFEGRVTVEVTSKKPLARTRILPEARGVRPNVTGDKVSFVLTEPGQFSIEPNVKNGPLLLFANPLEINPPKAGDTNVVFFGPGIHKADKIAIGAGKTLYIAGGAIVKGGVYAQGDHIRIRGRGIIDGLDWARFKGPTHNPIRLTKCKDVKVEGLILKDSWAWTFPMYACRDVHIDNVKIVSARCENNDGIGVCNSTNVKIENCFIRTDDDCITTKGFGEQLKIDPYPPVEDVTVERCVLWTDRAHIWRLGCECRAETMRRLVFKDIDVLHYSAPRNPAITVQPAEGMLMEDVRFENIRFNGEGQRRFIEITTEPTIWAKSKTPGNVRNVVFKDIVLHGTPGQALIEINGSDPSHRVEGVTFENVVRYGRPVTSSSPHRVHGRHTGKIEYK
jgi:hypothetical protein